MTRAITSVKIAEESAIAQAQALMYRAMKGAGLTKAALARRLRRSRATVTITLADGHGLRLRTVARWLDACGYALKLSLRKP